MEKNCFKTEENMADIDIIYVLEDKLPTYYDAAISIWSVCQSKEGKKEKSELKLLGRITSCLEKTY